MTLPDERYRALEHTELFLKQLMNPAITPRIPRRIREEAARCLRHFPGHHDLKQLERAAPHVVQQHMEPLYKMVLEHDVQDRIREDYRAAGLSRDGEEDVEARQP
jgi:hypothetical protein